MSQKTNKYVRNLKPDNYCKDVKLVNDTNVIKGVFKVGVGS